MDELYDDAEFDNLLLYDYEPMVETRTSGATDAASSNPYEAATMTYAVETNYLHNMDRQHNVRTVTDGDDGDPDDDVHADANTTVADDVDDNNTDVGEFVMTNASSNYNTPASIKSQPTDGDVGCGGNCADDNTIPDRRHVTTELNNNPNVEIANCTQPSTTRSSCSSSCSASSNTLTCDSSTSHTSSKLYLAA